MYRQYFKEMDSSFNLLYSSQEAAYDAIEQYKACLLYTSFQ